MIDPSELPPPDLLDTAGRIKRLALAFGLGLAAATAAFMICYALVQPGGRYAGGRPSSNFQFVAFFTLFAGGGCFWVALTVQDYLAKKKWLAELMPRARVRKR